MPQVIVDYTSSQTIVGPALPHIPWEERPAGSSTVVWRSTRNPIIPHDRKRYRERNQVERLVGRMKQFRRIATRYEKLTPTFLAMIHLTVAFIMIR